jgi:hypothetical protein
MRVPGLPLSRSKRMARALRGLKPDVGSVHKGCAASISRSLRVSPHPLSKVPERPGGSLVLLRGFQLWVTSFSSSQTRKLSPSANIMPD